MCFKKISKVKVVKMSQISEFINHDNEENISLMRKIIKKTEPS